MPDTNLETLLNQLSTSTDDETSEATAVALGRAGEAGLRLVDTLLDSENPDHRFWAIRALWANGSTAARERLIRCLEDGDELVRSGAVLALGEMGVEEAIEALGRLMRDDPSLVGHHAGDALAKIGEPAAQTLIDGLEDPRAWVRIRAARALVPVESRPAIAPLIQALEDDSYVVRHYAEEALTRMGVGQMVFFK